MIPLSIRMPHIIRHSVGCVEDSIVGAPEASLPDAEQTTLPSIAALLCNEGGCQVADVDGKMGNVDEIGKIIKDLQILLHPYQACLPHWGLLSLICRQAPICL